MKQLHIFTTGGTIDKVYFDSLSAFQVGETCIDSILQEANIGFACTLTSLMKKDSLDLTDSDRQIVHRAVSDCPETSILITHGTDTMAETGRYLQTIAGKTIVLTGAMQPARLRASDAAFNIGFAVAAAQMQAAGVYIAMNGRLFDADSVAKNRAAGQFVARS